MFPELSCLHEVRQFLLLSDRYNFTLITSEEFEYRVLGQNMPEHLKVVLLPIYSQNKSYLPGLDQQLVGKDIVITKGRTGISSYQMVKAKWRYKFRLFVLEDNVLGLSLSNDESARTIRQEINNAADQFIVHSKSVAKSLVFQGVHEDKISMFTPWVEVSPLCSREDREALRRDQYIGRNDLVVGIYGDLSSQMSVDEVFMCIVGALRVGSSNRRNLKFLINGSGKYLSLLKKEAVKLKLDESILFFDHTNYDQNMFYNVIDAAWFPRYTNDVTFSSSYYPYLCMMNLGIPIVAPRSPGAEETVDKHRLDYCFGSYESFSKAVDKIKSSKELVNNIITANKSKITNRFYMAKSKAS